MYRLKVVLVSLFSLMCVVALNPLQANAAEFGIDMNLACRQQHGWINTAYVRDWNAYGWRCKAGTGDDYHFGRVQLDLNRYCRDNHGGASAITRDPGNPFSWRCVK